MELLTLEECDTYFAVNYENNFDQFHESDNLPLLRTCLDLLSRLENTTHYHFAGRVLLFLAKLLPLFDRSGLNIISEVNNKELPSQVTETLRILAAKNSSKDEFEVDIEEGEAIDNEDEELISEDSDKLYERFWKIQSYLNQPNLLHDKNAWYSFRTHTDSLLTYLDNVKTSTSIWKVTSTYAVNSKTLYMQLSDENFRRCILLQLLIILRSDKTDQDPSGSWTSITITRIHVLLSQMFDSERSRKFLDFVKQVTQREELWERWKTDKCPELKKIDDDEIVNVRSTYTKRRKLGDELRIAKSYKMSVIGSPQLTKLWNQNDTDRFNVPSLEKFLEPTINEPPEKRLEIFKDAKYGFKALRLLSKKCSTFVVPSTNSVTNLSDYLSLAVEAVIPKKEVVKTVEDDSSQ